MLEEVRSDDESELTDNTSIQLRCEIRVAAVQHPIITQPPLLSHPPCHTKLHSPSIREKGNCRAGLQSRRHELGMMQIFLPISSSSS